MFDGEYKSSKRINMSGRSRQLTKEETLEKAKKEREQRQLERQKRDSTPIIQSWFRHLKAKKASHKQTLLLYKEAVNSFNVEQASIEKITYLLFLLVNCDYQDAIKEIEPFCVLLRNVANTMNQNVCTLILRDSNNLNNIDWQIMKKRLITFLRLCGDKCRVCSGETNTNYVLFAILQEISGQLNRDKLRDVLLNFLRFDNTLFQKLTDGVQTIEKNAAIYNRLLYLLETSNESPRSMARESCTNISNDFFKTLIKQISNQELRQIMCSPACTELLKHLSEAIFSPSIDTVQSKVITNPEYMNLQNCTVQELSSVILNAATLMNGRQGSSCANPLVIACSGAWMNAALEHLIHSIKHENSMEVDEEYDDYWQDVDETVESQFLLPEILQTEILQLVSAKSLQDITNVMFCCGGPYLIRMVFSLFYEMQFLSQPISKALFNFLTFSTKILVFGWQFILMNNVIDNIINYCASIITNKNTAIELDMNFDLRTVMLFLHCFYHLIMTLDDHAFFVEQKYFNTQNEIVKISEKLRSLLLALLSVRKKEEKWTQMKQQVTVVVDQLVQRNCRNKFVDESFWYCEEFGSDTFYSKMKADDEYVLEILLSCPFLVPSRAKFKIFHHKIKSNRMKSNYFDCVDIEIRREHFFKDAYSEMRSIGDWRKRVRVTFINEMGLEEAGIDGGGLFKEFMAMTMRMALDPNKGLFKQTGTGALFPNPSSRIADEDDEQLFEFIGKMLAKVLYEEMLVELPFAPFFLQTLLQRNKISPAMVIMTNLMALDPEMYKNLMVLRDYKGNVEEDFSLNFAISGSELEQEHEHELIPNGKNISVTNENRLEYILRVASYRVHTQIFRQCSAFRKGFFSLIDPDWVRIFTENELQLLISGVMSIDVKDWKINTVYHGYETTDNEIIWFWELVEEFDTKKRQQLLQFVTSVPMSPLLGFSCLNPKFAINACGNEADESEGRLPTASTCINLLKLPRYSSKEIMRERLIYAISSQAGFEFS